MGSNPLMHLKELGQSVWLDYIQRGMLHNGEFGRLVDEDGVCGVTSNPAILEKAIAHHDDYNEAIVSHAGTGRGTMEIYEALALSDVQLAADLLKPVYERTLGADGYVSLEVSPHLAYDTAGTVKEGVRLWTAFDRPNAMIKVPATRDGLEAVRELTAAGLNINATLLFSGERYRAVAEAFIAGLEARVAAGEPIDNIASVASFFMSRIDTLVDKQLEARDTADASQLRGYTAVACAKLAYQDYKAIYSSERWQALAAKGARPQRLLWASTGTKDPSYSDILYVDELIGPATVNTLPVATLEAYRDHGRPALRLEEGVAQAQAHVERLSQQDIDLEAIADELEQDGVQKFVEPFEQLLATIEKRART